jgi:hypothetical protein
MVGPAGNSNEGIFAQSNLGKGLESTTASVLEAAELPATNDISHSKGRNVSAETLLIKTLSCFHERCRQTAVAQWLRHYAINRQVAGSIPDGVIGIFQ